jgi:L-ascorbate metabolism protein UlaG (beta-lactamase superfamily)
MLNDAERRDGLRRERMRASKQWHDGRFHNPSGKGPGLEGERLPIIGEYFFGKAEKRPRSRLPLESPLASWARAPASGFRVTWLGHSTVLLELGGKTVLTDPVFADRASPVSFAGPRRFHPVPAKIAELPPLTAVLLSHDHYDHLCASSVRELAKLRVPFVTSLGVGARLVRLGVDPALVTELDWGERAEVDGVAFRATPAQHFSGRGFGDRNRTLWSSWVIETEERRIFFSGDTGLTDDFADVGHAFGPFDLVMLEVGAFHPAWASIHLGPENALLAHRMLGGGTLMPVHWSTFDLALHAWNEPGETLYELASKTGERLFLPRLGAPMEPDHVDLAVPWWRNLATAPRDGVIAPRLA